MHLPHLLPHSFSVDAAEARVLNFYNPACFEVMIMGCGRVATERRRPAMPESAPPESREEITLLSRRYGQEAVTALPFLQPSTDDLMKTKASDRSIGEPVIVTAAEVAAQRSIGLDWHRLLDRTQTGGTHEIFEVVSQSEAGQPSPTEPEDQALYVLDGGVDIEFADKRQTLASGAFAYLTAADAARWTLKADSRLLVVNL